MRVGYRDRYGDRREAVIDTDGEPVEEGIWYEGRDEAIGADVRVTWDAATDTWSEVQR